MISAEEAIEKLKEGNRLYTSIDTFQSDISAQTLEHFAKNGQEPYAIIISCSDSRVIPERVFHAAIGDLFTIRVAGNVIDDHQLGSIEYAAGHLGTNLIVVLGHTGCGAVSAAIHHDPSGFIKYITDEIKQAIGEETDDYKAAVLNVRQSIRHIEDSLEIQKDEAKGLKVVGAIYRIEDGTVEFLEEESDTAKQTQIRRIREMEIVFDRVQEWLKKTEDPVPNAEIRELLGKLSEYYESPLWKEDFAADEAGELPKDLKRGVLSEDGIYNLLENYMK